MNITQANFDDLPEILALPRVAYQSEAKLLKNDAIPPLTQTLEEVQEEFQKGVFLILKEDGNSRILGSVRGWVTENTLYIGKLMVHPDFQRRGFGTRLLHEIETYAPAHTRSELFTSTKSMQNLKLYQDAGFLPFREKEAAPGLTFVFLEKKK